MHPPYAVEAAAQFVADEEARAASPAALLNATQNFAFLYLMGQRARLDPQARAVLLKCAAAVRVLEQGPRNFGSAADCLTLLAGVDRAQVRERQADLIDYMRARGATKPTGD